MPICCIYNNFSLQSKLKTSYGSADGESGKQREGGEHECEGEHDANAARPLLPAAPGASLWAPMVGENMRQQLFFCTRRQCDQPARSL